MKIEELNNKSEQDVTGKNQKKKTIFGYPQNVDNDIDFLYGMRSQHILFLKERYSQKSIGQLVLSIY